MLATSGSAAWAALWYSWTGVSDEAEHDREVIDVFSPACGWRTWC